LCKGANTLGKFIDVPAGTVDLGAAGVEWMHDSNIAVSEGKPLPLQ
jgi:hypothetical protein